MKRLTTATLAELNSQTLLPGYNRDKTGVGIVHLGIGAFHRAHQAVYTDKAMSLSGGDWCITGVSLRSDTVAQQLLPQDCLYSVLSQDGQGQSLRLVGAVKDVLVATDQRQDVVDVIANPATCIITLTITEKGYCTGRDGLSLDLENMAIAADIADPEQPASAIGILALGLRQRQSTDGGAITIISCDNLSENGQVLASVLRQYVELTFPELGSWLSSNTRYPCSMVDRIVPATTATARLRQAQLLGADDFSAIATEPFSQWIIEDDFCSRRPDWQAAGVQFVDDIRPYENMKLGLLNASHSAIAYCGLLAGKETVDQVVIDNVLGGFIAALMDEELMPSLLVPAGFDLEAYKNQLLARFANPGLAHRCAQIAMDGSEKISQRWLPVLQRGGEPEKLMIALAAWCYLVLNTNIEISDPRSEELLVLRGRDDRRRLLDLLACARITAETVPDIDLCCQQLEQNMNKIQQVGIAAVMAG